MHKHPTAEEDASAAERRRLRAALAGGGDGGGAGPLEPGGSPLLSLLINVQFELHNRISQVRAVDTWSDGGRRWGGRGKGTDQVHNPVLDPPRTPTHMHTCARFLTAF